MREYKALNTGIQQNLTKRSYSHHDYCTLIDPLIFLGMALAESTRHVLGLLYYFWPPVAS
jgi:hypothetical protein